MVGLLGFCQFCSAWEYQTWWLGNLATATVGESYWMTEGGLEEKEGPNWLRVLLSPLIHVSGTGRLNPCQKAVHERPLWRCMANKEKNAMIYTSASNWFNLAPSRPGLQVTLWKIVSYSCQYRLRDRMVASRLLPDVWSGRGVKGGGTMVTKRKRNYLTRSLIGVRWSRELIFH